MRLYLVVFILLVLAKLYALDVIWALEQALVLFILYLGMQQKNYTSFVIFVLFLLVYFVTEFYYLGSLYHRGDLPKLLAPESPMKPKIAFVSLCISVLIYPFALGQCFVCYRELKALALEQGV